MNSHTIRILRFAYTLLEKYERNEVGLKYLVDSLAGSYNALEEKLPQEMVSGWFDHWGPLENILAINITYKDKYIDPSPAVEEFKVFIKEQMLLEKL